MTLPDVQALLEQLAEFTGSARFPSSLSRSSRPAPELALVEGEIVDATVASLQSEVRSGAAVLVPLDADEPLLACRSAPPVTRWGPRRRAHRSDPDGPTGAPDGPDAAPTSSNFSLCPDAGHRRGRHPTASSGSAAVTDG